MAKIKTWVGSKYRRYPKSAYRNKKNPRTSKKGIRPYGKGIKRTELVSRKTTIPYEHLSGPDKPRRTVKIGEFGSIKEAEREIAKRERRGLQVVRGR